MSRPRFVAVLVAAAAAAPVAAAAQAPNQSIGPTPEQRAACQADYDKFCVGMIPGDGRIIACLRRQYDQLSDACRKLIDANKRE
ncbi:MAG: hypothetical protein ABW213_02475 [Tardiphaga sp.]